MSDFLKWSPVIGKAFCYFLVAFLTPMSDQIADILTKDQWPTKQRWALALIIATIAAANTMRAYFDGSVQRHADLLANGKGKDETKITG